jgi:hypothetical protein
MILGVGANVGGTHIVVEFGVGANPSRQAHVVITTEAINILMH